MTDAPTERLTPTQAQHSEAFCDDL